MSRSIRKGPVMRRCPAPLTHIRQCNAMALTQLFRFDPHMLRTVQCKMTSDLRLESVFILPSFLPTKILNRDSLAWAPFCHRMGALFLLNEGARRACGICMGISLHWDTCG